MVFTVGKPPFEVMLDVAKWLKEEKPGNLSNRSFLLRDIADKIRVFKVSVSWPLGQRITPSWPREVKH